MAGIRNAAPYREFPGTDGNTALKVRRQNLRSGQMVMWDKEAGVFVPYRNPGRSYKLLRRHLIVLAAILGLLYVGAIVRSAALVRTGNQLVTLQMQESRLMNDNARLKLQVEKLRTPERITDLAERQLHLSVARSNIYLGTR
ncbi:MAG: hypothetical protein I3I94_08405 [Acidaminococcaceae bacterium]|jgi:cell division protein FtsL|nr:hypothetical protein [Acidaminococcaceae bacterium]HCJ90599.1 hypothetical protein [Acidaminococcaceae bacterium]